MMCSFNSWTPPSLMSENAPRYLVFFLKKNAQKNPLTEKFPWGGGQHSFEKLLHLNFLFGRIKKQFRVKIVGGAMPGAQWATLQKGGKSDGGVEGSVATAWTGDGLWRPERAWLQLHCSVCLGFSSDPQPDWKHVLTP